MTDSNKPGRKTLGIKTTSSDAPRKATRPLRVSDLNRKRVQDVVTGIKQAKERASDKDKRRAAPAEGAPRQDRQARPARPRPAEGERAPRRFAEGERAPRRFGDDERPPRYGDENRPAQPRRYGDDNRAERPRRYGDEDRAARPRRFGDEERPQRERRYGDDNRPAQPRRYGDDNRAERPRRYGDEDRAARPRRFGDEERPQRERRYGDDNRAAQPRRYGDDNRAERPRRFGDEDRAARPRRFGDDERPQRERGYGDDNRAAQPRRYGDDNRAERPRRPGDDERTQRTQRPHRSDESRAPRRQHHDDNAPRRGDAPARRFSDSSDRARPARGERAEHTERPAPRAEAHQPAPERDDGLVRLSKRMSELGLCSRREADEWIPRGWVLVDGEPVTELGSRVRPEAEIEILQAARSEQGERVTVLLNKPVGYVSGQAEDGYEPAAVLFAPENQWEEDPTRKRFAPWQRKNLAPAGRLDIDSTGLLVLTQDGRVARALIGEDSNIEKEYLVRVEWESPEGLVERNISAVFPDDQLERLRHGLSLDGVALKPAKVSWQNEEQLRFVLREGRKRQIRRMCEQVGLKVVGLKRVRMGRVVLGDLPPGKWRFLGQFEKF
ncbi:MAG: pseudouridine synthase [Cupriavidus sp.]|nr:pseudouridine synthase [Cupriavidus sp.]